MVADHAMVAGKSIDPDAVARFAGASLMVAHNSAAGQCAYFIHFPLLNSSSTFFAPLITALSWLHRRA